MAQGVGSVLGGPMAALLHDSTGSWIPVFSLVIVMDFGTAALAFFALKPLRRRWIARAHAAEGAAAGAGEWGAVSSRS